MVEVVVALISLLGVLAVEYLRRASNKRKEAQEELLLEIRELKQQVVHLQESLDEWKSKYYLLLLEMTKEEQ
ncbi:MULTISPECIES: hypothetical protein [Rhodococcus]|uniref:hypothetical protein n=1 Tax=Rhodococcus TaxID=1827 RepID=UPI00117B6FA4|nr:MULTISPECIES: hypothetical protein [Rhodococcus]MCC4303981.1 hypothetical protein [Rhodococcus sp. 3-2]